jgi:hypothetical protein
MLYNSVLGSDGWLFSLTPTRVRLGPFADRVAKFPKRIGGEAGFASDCSTSTAQRDSAVPVYSSESPAFRVLNSLFCVGRLLGGSLNPYIY